MKRPCLIKKTMILILCSFFLSQCSNIDNASNKTIKNHNVNLIPFTEYNSSGNEQREYLNDDRKQKWGYLDETTGEIVIKAKYDYAYPFVGGFAYAWLDWHRKTIINRYGKVVNVGKFDEVYLFTSESGKNTMAVLGNKYERKVFRIDIDSFKPYFEIEEYYKYRLVNLVTGKTIIPKKENYLYHGVEIVGDYFLIEPDTGRTDLYQFLDNGDVKCVVKDNPALAAEILKTYLEGRGINADVKAGFQVWIDYRPYIKKIFADPDLSGAISHSAAELTFAEAQPFYRDHRELLNASIEIIEREYLLYFNIKGTSTRAIGIYNESKAEWVIRPTFTINYTDTGEKERYYTIKILQTNNPNLYKLQFTNEEVGWDRQLQISGGLYSIIENDYMIHDFMPNLHLFNDYPPKGGLILMMGGGGKRIINFPDKGVYYSDYSRLKSK